MRGAILALAVLLQAQAPFHHPARHVQRPLPEKTAPAPVFRIDSLIATEQGGRLSIEAKGAVSGGGWRHAALKLAKGNGPADLHVLVLDFMAEPPSPANVVIPGLMPVAASIALRPRRNLVSVRVVSASNEITSQILKSAR